MPAAKKTAPVATLTTCIVLVTHREGSLDNVSCFGGEEGLERAVQSASALSEDGDGTFSYSVKRLHSARAKAVLDIAKRMTQGGNYDRLSDEMLRAYVTIP